MHKKVASAMAILKSFKTLRSRVSSTSSTTFHDSIDINSSKPNHRFLQTLSSSAFHRQNSREQPSPQVKIITHCPSFGVMPYLIHRNARTYSSAANNTPDSINLAAESSKGEVPSQGNDSFIRVYDSVLEAVRKTGDMAKEAADEAGHYTEKLFESYPYLKDIVVPVGWTLSSIALAWIVLPRVLRRFHHYAKQTPLMLLSGRFAQEVVPYEKSVWGSLEDPARYLVTFIAFSQLGVFIAPSTTQYLSQAWRGAIVLSVVWFLHRWKTNVLSFLLAKKSTVGHDRDRMVALDKFSSVGLIILGMMALAEACGIAVQSILTVGGIGGVATAFAARDILGNLLSGLSILFSQPFSIGDNIKAGSIEGRVTEMGLTSTSLISQENFPVIVPNSLFSSQVIVNKTRAQHRALLKKIPFSIDDVEKIPNISENVKSMLRVHPDVVPEREPPFCFLSHIEDSYAELTVGCTLKNKGKAELYATEQDIVLQVVQIVKQEGARLGSTLSHFGSP